LQVTGFSCGETLTCGFPDPCSGLLGHAPSGLAGGEQVAASGAAVAAGADHLVGQPAHDVGHAALWLPHHGRVMVLACDGPVAVCDEQDAVAAHRHAWRRRGQQNERVAVVAARHDKHCAQGDLGHANKEQHCPQEPRLSHFYVVG
jgi:hypothetical protein